MISYINSIQKMQESMFLDEYINGVVFTKRELDIISCIVNAKRIKQIARLLDITPRTVETHIRNITHKLSCNSQIKIIEIIEETGNKEIFIKYYHQLILFRMFENKLIQISKGLEKEVFCFINLKNLDDFNNHLLSDFFLKHLKQSGIKITNDSKVVAHNIYFLTKESIENTKDKNTFYLIYNSDFIFNTHSENTFYIKDDESYIQAFSNIIKTLVGRADLETILSEVKTLPNEREDKKEINIIKNNKLKIKLTSTIKKLYPNIKSSRLYIYCFIFLFIFFMHKSDLFLTFFNKPNTSNVIPIRNQLLLPHPSKLLKRDELINSLKNIPLDLNDINVVAIIGTGGSGKTTIARKYLKDLKNEIVWEINCRTLDGIRSSFEELAYSCAKKHNKEEAFSKIIAITNAEEKNKKILLFVQQQLKIYDKWVLLYDEADDLKIISEYFPHDVHIWGRGKVIITSRDANIDRIFYIKDSNIIRIGEINSQEQLSLFLTICNHYKNKKNNNTILQFLKNIPPYPLDTITAAYFIKRNSINFDQYLNLLKERSDLFSIEQSAILGDVNNYSQSRFGIISVTIEKILQAHPEFKNIILLTALLDSRYIPIELLECFSSPVLVNQYINVLQKESFIDETDNKRTEEKTFSIHHSIQNFILFYLLKKFDLTNDKKILLELSTTLIDYMKILVCDKNISKIKKVFVHIQRILDHKLLSPENQNDISYILSKFYFLLGEYNKGIELLKKNVSSLENQFDKDSSYRLIDNLMCLGITYAHNEELEKAVNVMDDLFNRFGDKIHTNKDLKIEFYQQMGTVHNFAGNLKKSKYFLEKSLSLCNTMQGKDALKADIFRSLGVLNRLLGFYNDSEKHFKTALNLYLTTLGDEHIETAQCYLGLGMLNILTAQYENAKIYLEKSYKLYKNHYGDDNVETAYVLSYLGNLYSKIGDSAALPCVEKSLKVSISNFGVESLDTAIFLRNKAIVLIEYKQLEQAENLLLNSLPFFKNNAPEYIICCQTLGLLFLQKSNLIKNKDKKTYEQLVAKSKSFFEKAIKKANDEFPAHNIHEEIKRAMNESSVG